MKCDADRGGHGERVAGRHELARGRVNLECDQIVRILIGDQQELSTRAEGKVAGGLPACLLMPEEGERAILPIDGIANDAVMTAVRSVEKLT